MEDLINESINIMGHSCWYIPRESFSAPDFIFGEDTNKKFERSYLIPTYLANVEGYEGDGDFFSKFGLDVRDTSNFVLARRTFERYVPSSVCTRPREGDLIYVPVIRKLFEVKFVEEELMFFSLGKRNPYIYELRCEMFRYSNESLNTGVDEVDVIEERVGYSQMFALSSGSGAFQRGETVYQGDSLITATASAEVKEWTGSTKKLEVINIKGVFAANASIHGATSGVTYHVVNTDTIADNSDYDVWDNRLFEDEANNFIDFSESNPFGTP